MKQLFSHTLVWIAPVLFSTLLTTSCRRKETSDASVRDAAIARPIPVRTAAPGERLANLDASKISLAIIKDRDVATPVTATLKLRDGRLKLANTTGTAHLSIDLMSFDSGIPLRNERVRNYFFETSAIGWETAELEIPKFPEEALTALQGGKRVVHAKVEGDLRLHGRTSKVVMQVDAGYEPNGVLRVTSAVPVELKIAEFGLGDNLKRLSALCMHDSIDDVVKVDVTIDFAAPK